MVNLGYMIISENVGQKLFFNARSYDPALGKPNTISAMDG